MTNYEKQGTDFLKKTDCKMTVKFKGTESMSWDKDGTKRDVYNVILEKGNIKYSFDFGQNLMHSSQYISPHTGERFGLDLKSLNGSGRCIVEGCEQRYILVTPENIKKKQKIPPIMLGSTHNSKEIKAIKEALFDSVKEPTAYSVLACITKHDPELFEDFCDEYGYDKDSIKAKETYEAVREEWVYVNKLFTDEEIEELQEIQ